jgi:hypothetical protein
MDITTKQILEKVVKVYVEMMRDVAQGGSWKDGYRFYTRKYGEQLANNLYFLIQKLILESGLHD